MKQTTGTIETQRMIHEMLEMMTEDEVESIRKIMAAILKGRPVSADKQKT